jgi:hypothetical protein
MPIVASRGDQIQRLLDALADPKSRGGSVIRLRAVGARIVPHVAESFTRMTAEARATVIDILADVETADARTLRRRLQRVDPGPEPPAAAESTHRAHDGAEARALAELKRLPPPQRNERANVSRERGEAHLALARAESRLARKDLLVSLETLDAPRLRVYCEAAALIGDMAFLAPLARIAKKGDAAAAAIAAIAKRERITARSKVLASLDATSRTAVLQALSDL